MPQHRRYLESRGFDPKAIQTLWDVKSIGLAAKLGWRLYIPIYFEQEKVSWTTRSIDPNAKRRYVSASASEELINHKELVYGLDYCHHSVIIVEGPIDAWAVGPGGGALFGTAFTPSQVQKISAIPNRYVCFDSSKDAQAQAVKLCHQLSLLPGHTENIILDAKDPGCASRKEIKLLRKAAQL